MMSKTSEPSYKHFLSIFSRILNHVGSSSTTRTRRPAGKASWRGEEKQPLSMLLERRVIWITASEFKKKMALLLWV